MYQHWMPFSVGQSFYSKKSLFDNSNLKNAIKETFNDIEVKRDLTISGLNLVSGQVVDMMKQTDNITAL